jgi:universal stress protein E
MSAIKRILVAIAEPASRRQPALAKALQLARRTGAEIEVLHCLFDRRIQEAVVYRGGRAAVEQIVESLVEAARVRLERRAAALARAGLRVRVSVRWDYPAHEAIIRQALRHRSDFVVAATHRHHRLARPFLSNTDWQLIRLCPVPLLLVKSSRAWKTPKVLCAVDPLHLRAKPTALDPRILKVGGQLARALGGSLHAVHAYAPLLEYLPAVMGAPAQVVATGPEAREHAKRIGRKVLIETRRFALSERRVHVIAGEPQVILPRVRQQLHAQIVVMGAVSRSGLNRFFIGNTAERVIDELSCDLCVVKTPGFRTTVPARAHLPIDVLP